MRIGETHESTRSLSNFEAPAKVGTRDSRQSSRPQGTENSQPSDRATLSSSRVFGEASSNQDRSLARSHSAPDMSSLHIPAVLSAAMIELVSGDRAEVQSLSSGSTHSAQRDVEAQRAEIGQPARISDSSSQVDAPDEELAPRDAVISVSARAASALAAAVEKVPFGAIALGGASNLADFLAPAVVDGIKEPLSRSVAAAGFSGVFLGLTASVTTALGNDVARLITENRVTPTVPEGEVSRGSQLWSAVKNQTIPAMIGFAGAFVTANALDAETGKLGNTELNLETALLKLARATAGAVGLGLAAEAAKQAFSDHSLTRTEANRVFDNTRSLGEAIKRNVTSLPQAVSAYTRPTERGGATEFGNVLGAAFGFATFAAIYGVVSAALQSTYGENTGERLSEPAVKAAIATAAGVAGFVIADQLTRNIYANVVPTREVSAISDHETV